LLDAMFMSAIPPLPRLFAQYVVVVNSGNSDRNGATHWTNTNCETPITPASPIMLERNGCATSASAPPPTTNSAAIASHRINGARATTARGTASTTPTCTST
jgi:hypothetical protein